MDVEIMMNSRIPYYMQNNSSMTLSDSENNTWSYITWERYTTKDNARISRFDKTVLYKLYVFSCCN